MDRESLICKMEKILRGELELFHEMERCSREQLAALSLDCPDVEKAARLMSQKQTIVDRLDELDASSGEIKAEWQRVASEVPEEKRDRVRRLGSDMASVLETLMALEKESEAKLRQCSTALNRELASLQRARLASRAYGNRYGPEDARFLDRKQ
jgi:uncharacterized protein YukE